MPRRAGWSLVEQLGEGGFGEVWLARHGNEERVFKFCFDLARLRALKREVTLFRLLRETLGHRPDIARLIGWDFSALPFFLESSYTDGGDLPHWSDHHGGLAAIPLVTRLELVAQVAEALAAAHSVGVLHKDVKPQNILVAHDQDGRPRAVLTDFGLGLLTRPEALESPGFSVLGFTEVARASSDSAAGTARYMAPELFAGKPATIEADVYSLGVLLYQMALGDFGRGLAEGWRREIDDELLAADIAACVDGSPERRLRDGAELAERLRNLAERRLRRQEENARTLAAQRAQRRRRVTRWLGVAAAGIVPLLSIFAYLTYQAKNRELLARQHEEKRRQQAEALIDFMLGDLRQQLQPIGKLKILDQVGDRALEYFAAVREGDLSPAELASYAKTMHQIGQVRFGLGKKPEAKAAFVASLALARRLAASDPKNQQWQFELGQSHFWVGFLWWKERKLDQAMAEFEAYLRISAELVARDPQNSDWQLELAYSYSNIGSIAEEQNDLDRAASSFATSLKVFDELIGRRKETAELLVEAAKIDVKLAEVLHRRGDLEGAIARHRAALSNYQAALAQDPANALLLTSASSVKGYLGNLLLELGDPAGARDLFRADLEIMEGLVRRDPDNFNYKELLSSRINRLGRALLASGNLAEARQALTRDRALTAELLAKNAEVPAWLFARARNWCSWSLLALAEQDPRQTRLAASSCRDILGKLPATGEDRSYRWWLARSHWLLGLAHRRMGEPESAILACREGAAIARPLIETHPLPGEMDLFVRLSSCSDNAAEARPWLARLSAIHYRESAFLAFLAEK